MDVEDTIQQIASRPQDYKYCKQCGLINWGENKSCHECGGRGFNPMTKSDAAELLRDWKREEEFRLRVA